jgi:hypothetical protein
MENQVQFPIRGQLVAEVDRKVGTAAGERGPNDNRETDLSTTGEEEIYGQKINLLMVRGS